MTENLKRNDESPQPNQDQSFPPRALCIAGALAIAVGVRSLVEMVAGFIAGDFSLNFGFIGIIIGCGILIGRSSSRAWAIFFSGLGLVQCLAIGGIVIYRHFSGKEPLVYPDSIYGAVELSLLLACNIYVFAVLIHKDQRKWFEQVKKVSAPTKNLAWAAGTITAVFTISHYVTHWWIEETLERIHPLHLNIRPYDSVTGKGVSSSISCDSIGKSGRSFKSKLPRINPIFQVEQGAMLITLSGIATHPFKFEIISEGYHNKTITIDPSSQDEIRVPMQPLHITVDPEKP